MLLQVMYYTSHHLGQVFVPYVVAGGSGSIRQHMSAYVSIRQHTSAYVLMPYVVAGGSASY
jgi:hypothetical protein